MFQVNEREEKFDMEEIGDGSTYSKNHIEFWCKWKVKREEANEEFLKNLNNLPKGVEILEVRPGQQHIEYFYHPFIFGWRFKPLYSKTK